MLKSAAQKPGGPLGSELSIVLLLQQCASLTDAAEVLEQYVTQFNVFCVPHFLTDSDVNALIFATEVQLQQSQ